MTIHKAASNVKMQVIKERLQDQQKELNKKKDKLSMLTALWQIQDKMSDLPPNVIHEIKTTVLAASRKIITDDQCTTIILKMLKDNS